MIASAAEITLNTGYAIASLDCVTFNWTKFQERSLLFYPVFPRNDIQKVSI
mgnify:FL=1